jgi:predicted dehydrogenase
MTLRVGLVGAGLAGRSHAFDIVTEPGMSVAGAVGTGSPRAAEMTAEFGGVVYPDLDALLSDATVGAVVIAVPPSAVFGIVDRVTQSGIPALVEKPVAAKEADLSSLLRAVRCSGHVSVPFNRRYQPHVRAAAAALAAGDLGEVHTVIATWHGPYQVRFQTGSGTYRATAGTRQGVLTDSGVHALDLIALMLGGVGKPVVKAVAIRRNDRGADVQADVTWEDAATGVTVSLAVIDTPRATAGGEWTFTACGSVGNLVLDGQGMRLDGARGRQVPAGQMERPVTDLLRLQDGLAPVGASLAVAAELSSVLMAIYDSARAALHRPRWKALGRLNGAC